MAAKKPSTNGRIAENRRARFEYEVLETLEAGIELVGTEVKSLRSGKTNIADSYISPEANQLMLINTYIPPYEQGNRFNHTERRPRRLLMHRSEIDKLARATEREGMTLIPLKMYFNAKGRAKVLVGLCRGKKLHDKRQTAKDRDWARSKARLMRNLG